MKNLELAFNVQEIETHEMRELNSGINRLPGKVILLEDYTKNEIEDALDKLFESGKLEFTLPNNFKVVTFK